MNTLNNGGKYGVVINLTIHSPSSEETIKKETATVQNDNGAEKGTVRVQAKRIPAKYMTPIQSVSGQIRAFCEKNSMRINGQYVVPFANIKAFWLGLYGHDDITSDEVKGGLLGKFNTNIDVLMAACADGSFRIEMEKLGKLLDQVDIIDCAAIRKDFGIDVRLSSDLHNPNVQSILKSMNSDLVAALETRVKADAEKSYNEGLTEITGKLSGMIIGTLTEIVSKSKENAKGTHYAALVRRVKELTETLPQFNVLNDPKVSATIADIYKSLAKFETEDYRNDKLRETAIAESERILAEFQGLPVPVAPPAPVQETAPASVNVTAEVLKETAKGNAKGKAKKGKASPVVAPTISLDNVPA